MRVSHSDYPIFHSSVEMKVLILIPIHNTYTVSDSWPHSVSLQAFPGGAARPQPLILPRQETPRS